MNTNCAPEEKLRMKISITRCAVQTDVLIDNSSERRMC